MKHKTLLLLLIGITLLGNCYSKTTDGRPNIIIILSDDMGYSDLGCYGGEVHTPNLDELAANGLRFTQFYNAARCCPTRASLMTGCYPHQTGIGHMTNPPNKLSHDLGVREYRGSLNFENVTIAEALKEAGYSTLMTGKWHLGLEDHSKWPLQRGFDKFYGLLAGASNFFKPTGERGITYMNKPIDITDENYYVTDAFTDYAIQFIDEAKEESAQPFFLYLAYTAPHWPLHAFKEDIDKYRGKYMNGWAPIRKERFERMKEMGLIEQDWALSAQDAREWDSLSDEKKTEMDLRRAIYSGQIDRMDQNIGRLVAHLKTKNELDNTLIIFLNDNGACAEGGMLGGGSKEILETKEGYWLSYGKAWANASNTPYRMFKHYVHEGGISTPFIAHWPNGIKGKGKIVKQYGFLPDLMATCIDLAGTEYPTNYKNNKIVHSPGKSLTPIFDGGRDEIHTSPIFWEHEGNKAVRLGKYKLVSKWNNKNEYNWELYDIEKDRTETNDLSQQHPDIVNELSNAYSKWAYENNILPWKDIKKMRQQKKNKNDVKH